MIRVGLIIFHRGLLGLTAESALFECCSAVELFDSFDALLCPFSLLYLYLVIVGLGFPTC